MKPFKTISNSSSKEYKQILNFVMDGVEIPKKTGHSDPQIKALATQVNPKLDDVIDAVEDHIKQHEILNIPTDGTELPKEYPLKNKDWVDKTLWKILRGDGKYDEKTALLKYKQAIAGRIIFIKVVKMVTRWLLKVFIQMKLDKFAATKINQYFKNGELHKWFTYQINEVYYNHPEYEPVTIAELKKTSIWNRIASEWREQSKNQKIRKLSKVGLSAVIGVLCTMIIFYSS